MNFNFFIKNGKEKEIKATKLALEAEVHKQNSKYGYAIKILNKAIKLCPNNDSFFYQRSLILISQKKYNQALKDINSAIKLNSEIYYFYLTRSDIYSLLNKEQEEIENFKKAYNILPKAYLYYEYQYKKTQENNKSAQSDFYKKRLDRFKNLIEIC